MEMMKFEPFYNDGEADKFRFYSVPQILFTDDKFCGISALSKLLYGFLLDRVGLSRKKNWFDEDGKVYVYFQISEGMEKLNISKTTCVKLFKELEEIGLIERKRQGQGMPTKIYVRNFSRSQREETPVESSVESMLNPVENLDEARSRSSKSEPLEVQNLNLQRFAKQTSRSSKSEPQEVHNLNLSTSYNQPNNHPDNPSFLSSAKGKEEMEEHGMLKNCDSDYEAACKQVESRFNTVEILYFSNY